MPGWAREVIFILISDLHSFKYHFMKRILYVCAGESLPDGAFTLLKSLRAHEPVSVMGLFFSPIDYVGAASASYIPIAAPYTRVQEKEKKAVQNNKALFEKECRSNHIPCELHPNDGEWDKSILGKESRFSDLVLLSGELFYDELSNDQPNSLLQEALHASECPVVIVPEGFTSFEHLVFAYDGGKESLFAMKQFCYLLPQYTDLPTEIIYVKDESTQEIPDIDQLKRFSRLHFESMGFSKLHFKAANYFATWIGEKHRVLMVSGSFGRSPFSYVAKRSFAEKVIHDHKMPVFIAHT
jgi:hypothetical protein